MPRKYDKDNEHNIMFNLRVITYFQHLFVLLIVIKLYVFTACLHFKCNYYIRLKGNIHNTLILFIHIFNNYFSVCISFKFSRTTPPCLLLCRHGNHSYLQTSMKFHNFTFKLENVLLKIQSLIMSLYPQYYIVPVQ